MAQLAGVDWVFIGLYFVVLFAGATYATWRKRGAAPCSPGS